jgi:hypothetical protein
MKEQEQKETYYDDQMRSIWLEYGHEPDDEERPPSHKEVR